MTSQTPPTLLDIISNHVVFTQLAPYLSISVVSRTFESIIYDDPSTFRRLDLSTARGIPFELCECEDADEHEKEDVSASHLLGLEWTWPYLENTHCMPLMKLTSMLAKRNILAHIRTLILDRQYVHFKQLRAILLDGVCGIRLVSPINVKHLDFPTFRQFIVNICSNDDRLGSLKLEGIYLFGPPVSLLELETPFEGEWPPARPLEPENNVTGTSGSTEWCNPWTPHPGGTVLQERRGDGLYNDAHLLKSTKGIIAWDAVLCRGPKHSQVMSNPDRINAPIIHPIVRTATVALGSSGCHICHSSPEGPGSTLSQLPLLSPPPIHASSVEAAQQAPFSHENGTASSPFYARCSRCTMDRWCKGCNKWWCENCYTPGGPNCYAVAPPGNATDSQCRCKGMTPL